MNTLKLDINELEIDEFQKEIYQNDDNRYFEFNEGFKSSVIIPPVSQYKTINFSEVSNPFCIVIISDKLINAKINGFEITNTKMVVLNTYISSVQIANVDLSDANVSISVWGKQN